MQRGELRKKNYHSGLFIYFQKSYFFTLSQINDTKNGDEPISRYKVCKEKRLH
jgi:hypothetical protein